MVGVVGFEPTVYRSLRQLQCQVIHVSVSAIGLTGACRPAWLPEYTFAWIPSGLYPHHGLRGDPLVALGFLGCIQESSQAPGLSPMDHVLRELQAPLLQEREVFLSVPQAVWEHDWDFVHYGIVPPALRAGEDTVDDYISPPKSELEHIKRVMLVYRAGQDFYELPLHGSLGLTRVFLRASSMAASSQSRYMVKPNHPVPTSPANPFPWRRNSQSSPRIASQAGRLKQLNPQEKKSRLAGHSAWVRPGLVPNPDSQEGEKSNRASPRCY